MADDYMTATQARQEYGLSTERMKQLLLDETIPHIPHPHDKRVKLVKRADMEAWRKAAEGLPTAKRRTRKPKT